MNNIIIGDADSLVALADKDDANHQKAERISEWLLLKGFQVIYPNTAILEAITALSRAKNLPDKAKLISNGYRKGLFSVEYVTWDIQARAGEIFETKSHSKKNTVFDAIVAATAQTLKTNLIFSFDGWYIKLGFKLAGNELL